MSNHSTEITETLEENGHFVLVVHCCGEHEYRHSLWAEVLDDPKKLEAAVQSAHEGAAHSHKARINALQRFSVLKGHKVSH